jgi:uncharacterized protein with von Willebrand factor type A (vWA) domain
MRVNAFYNRIGSVMRDNMYDRTVVGYRSGSIASRSLYKTQIENQTKVFARKQERENKQYSISILLDVSGSMRGSRIEMATEMVEILVKGLEKNNIRFALTFFGEGFHTYKTFEQKLNKSMLADANAKLHSAMGNNTLEGRALLESYRLLKGERGTRNNRFCLVFTDGQSGDEIKKPLKDLLKIAKVFPFGMSIDLAYSHGFGMKVCNKDMFMFKLLRALEANIARG